jgi:DNA (cytosine-5)-methyltransferase 1
LTTFHSFCSGIEAASVAWGPLGWECLSVSEIDKFPAEVLAHHFPTVPNLGDMTDVEAVDDAIGDVPGDVWIAGTPCQSFSVAGQRAGLDDPRGNLALIYAGLLRRHHPRWFVWENVPGVLSSGGGADFRAILRAFGDAGYGLAWRVLDAQWFGVAQRRRRVFVVGHFGDWRPAAAVLFERPGVSGCPAPSRKKGEGAAADVAGSLGASDRGVARTGESRGQDPLVASALPASAGHHGHGSPRGDGADNLIVSNAEGATGNPVLTSSNQTPLVVHGYTVRRLTPRECERLQGFPDDWTRIPRNGKPAEDCPDGPRYAAIGNSMAVPVIRWIGARIETVDQILRGSR